MAAARFPEIDLASLSGAQKEFADRILGFSLNGLAGPFVALLRAPELGQHLLSLGEKLRFAMGIEDRLVELAILTHAAAWDDHYEWAMHYRRALDAGLSLDVVEALRLGIGPDFTREDERVIHAAAWQVSKVRRLDDDRFADLEKLLGLEGTARFAVLMGQYAMLSSILAVAQVVPPDNRAPLLVRPTDEIGEE